jgi:hypothetical protein
MANNLIEIIERQELIEKLTAKGYGPLVEALLTNENKVYTKKGRLNKSGACRVLSWKTKQLEDALQECREILRNDLSDDVEEND